jgi:hypothetical protein
MKRIFLFIPVAIMALSGCTKKTNNPPTPVQETPIASSTPQNKNVVLEDFTGVRCGYCPDGHIRAKAFSDANPGRVFIIATHAGGYATPLTGWPDYTTQFGEGIRAQTGLAGYPAGTINRRKFTSPAPQAPNAMALNRDVWGTAGAQILAEPAPVNIGMQTSWDENTRTLSVTAETYYTADETVANNLNIALTEDGVIGKQEDYSLPSPYLNPNYTQNNMLRWYFTGQWGETIASTKTGNRAKKVYTYVVPSTVNIDNCNVVAFVDRGQVEIINAAKVKAH